MNDNQWPGDPAMPDPEWLKSLVRTKMPFGKYKNTPLSRLPVFYLEWFARKGFPKGKLGKQLEAVYEIKLNGLDDILKTVEKIS